MRWTLRERLREARHHRSLPSLLIGTETSPGSSAGAFLALLPRFPSHFRAGGLLWGSAWTFGQTRSDSGDTEGARQRLPRTRALESLLVCCPQARLRTFPTGGVPLSGTRGKQVSWIEIGGQK